MGRGAAWMFAGTAVYAACQWVIAVVLARIGGPEAVGLFALGSAIAMPIVVISQLGLRQALVTDLNAKRPFADYFALRVFATVIAFGVVFFICVAVGYRGNSLIALASIAAGRCCESISDIHYARLQRDERLDLIAQFTMLRGVLSLTLVALSFVLTESVAIAGLAFAAACAVSMVAVDAKLSRASWRATELLQSTQRAAGLAAVALPLAVSQFFNNLSGNVPRYVLEYVGGARLLGQYAAIEHFIIAATLVVQAVGQAAAPRLARHFCSKDFENYRKLVKLLLVIFVGAGAVLTLIALAVGPELIRLVYGPGFAEAERSMHWVAMATVFSFAASVFGYAATATGQFNGLGWRYAVIAVTTAAVAFALTPAWSLQGLAIAIAIGSLVACVIAGAFVAKALATAAQAEPTR